MKTANEIRMQGKRMIAVLDKTSPDYSVKLHRIAEICRAYLGRIAYHYKKPYGLKTWAKIGNRQLPRKIYAGY